VNRHDAAHFQSRWTDAFRDSLMFRNRDVGDDAVRMSAFTEDDQL
jgi:hypothetical protein